MISIIISLVNVTHRSTRMQRVDATKRKKRWCETDNKIIITLKTPILLPLPFFFCPGSQRYVEIRGKIKMVYNFYYRRDKN